MEAKTPKQIFELNWGSLERDLRFIILEELESWRIDMLILSESTDMAEG